MAEPVNFFFSETKSASPTTWVDKSAELTDIMYMQDSLDVGNNIYSLIII